jgi:DNA-binding GntR family transcriptional regulator
VKLAVTIEGSRFMSLNSEELGRIEQTPALRQRVYDRLEALIINRTLKPGSRLVEGELATRLGVSRGPIREALQMLERDGWVELQAHHGAFVHTPTEKEVDDFYALRRVLEVESAKTAARAITPDGAKRLRASLKSARELLARGENPLTVSYADPNRVTLHEEIVELGGNVALKNVLTLLTKRNVWYAVPSRVTRETAWDEHAAIVEAICDGNEEKAMDLMGRHLDHARIEFHHVLPQLPELSEQIST